MILTISPGATSSHWLTINPDYSIIDSGLLPNPLLLEKLKHPNLSFLVLDNPYPPDKFFYANLDVQTIIWTGRFIQASPVNYLRISRLATLSHLSGPDTSNRRNYYSAIQEICKRYPITSPSKRIHPAIGTKRHPGPLFHIKGELWFTLATAITLIELFQTHTSETQS